MSKEQIIYEVISERAAGKETLYDSDIYDILEELKERGVNASYKQIERIINANEYTKPIVTKNSPMDGKKAREMLRWSLAEGLISVTGGLFETKDVELAESALLYILNEETG